jgi:hypothetical protein
MFMIDKDKNFLVGLPRGLKFVEISPLLLISRNGQTCREAGTQSFRSSR